MCQHAASEAHASLPKDDADAFLLALNIVAAEACFYRMSSRQHVSIQGRAPQNKCAGLYQCSIQETLQLCCKASSWSQRHVASLITSVSSGEIYGCCVTFCINQSRCLPTCLWSQDMCPLGGAAPAREVPRPQNTKDSNGARLLHSCLQMLLQHQAILYNSLQQLRSCSPRPHSNLWWTCITPLQCSHCSSPDVARRTHPDQLRLG